jgi:CHAT domain-containing protein
LKPASILACCILVLPLVGTAPPSVPRRRAKLLPADGRTARRKSLDAEKQEALDLYRHARYAEAEARFAALSGSALALGEYDLAARSLINVGASQFAHRQYGNALRTFMESRRLAEKAGDLNITAIADINLGSLYREMGDLDAAVHWTERSFEKMSGEDRKLHLPEIQITLASLRASQQHMPEALELFRQAMEGAERASNLALYASASNRLGEELLRAHMLPEAESALLEAYRVRRLHHLALDSSYRSLGRLRLEQGDLSSASVMLDRAVELTASQSGPLPTWDIYHYRGRVRLQQGRTAEAVDDLRTALRLARAWRWSAPPDDASRIGNEGWLDQVYSTFIEAGNRLCLETGDRALIRETFEAAEENRASSLRALFKERQAQIAELPPSYWDATAELQRAEIAALKTADPAAQRTVQATRANLRVMEAALTSSPDSKPGEVLARSTVALGSDSLLLTFRLGESVSWLWAVDQAGVALYRLPPRNAIREQAQAAARAIREERADSSAAGAELYRMLFSALPPRSRVKARWLLSLDPALLDVPVAALLEETAPVPIYVAERHTIQVIPGAGYWLESSERNAGIRASGLFVGVGDPIYNTADPRAKRAPVSRASFWPLRSAASLRSDSLTLPRLVGSAAELDACARAWNSESALLKGAAASRANVIDQLRRRPAVVHFATHFVGTKVRETHADEGRVRGTDNRLAYGLIALSLTDRDEPELLQPAEIASWRLETGLVVLSGCDSAEGTILEGTGLMGLTRAWLAAGAQSVVASRWATPDEDGALFRSFYRHLREQGGADPARALKAAQVDMIRSHGWRRHPQYWGAYFMVGS